MLKKIALPIAAALPFVFVACSVEPTPPEAISQPVVVTKAAMARSMMPMHSAQARRGEDPARVTAGPLAYYGGRVISNVKVYAVNWEPNVNAEVKAGIGAFYQAVTNSAYFDWLSEYDTVGKNGIDGQPGSNQRVGRWSVWR